jgi:hypothetical protein
MRRLLLPFLCFCAVCLPACTGDGHFTFLGYTTKPNYDEKYKYVYVPIFKTAAFQSGPLRGLEYEVTSAVQKQIEAITTYKVVSYREGADTELLGTITMTPLAVTNRNQLNEIREGEQAIQIDVIWRDLRTGEILSKPAPAAGVAFPGPPPAGAPGPATTIRVTARFVPELGESQTTALHRASQKIAVQVVSLMEKPWGCPPQ